jgi:hypothetical protein
MALHLVAIWNCTMAPGWQKLDINDRVDALRSAIRKAEQKSIAAACGGRCILVAPEYAFAAVENPQNAKPAEQAEKHVLDYLIGECKLLTTHYRGTVLIPGTVAWKERVTSDWYRAWNAGFAFYQGQMLTRWEKRVGVGEISAQDAVAKPRLSLGAGLGYGQFDNQGHSWGLEICRDATHGGTLPVDVDLHVVVGQGVGLGVGHNFIHNRGIEYSIVADPGAFDVVDQRNQNRAVRQLPSGRALFGAKLHYWTIDL